LITPLGTSKKAGRNQILFKASELLNLGLQYGKITDIGLNIKGISNPLIAYDGLQIGMKLVNEDSLTDMQNDFSMVYYSISVVSVGWNNIPLQFPFTWDGESDLLIEICFSKQFNNSKDILVEVSDAGFKANAFGDGQGSDNSTVGCDLNFAGNSNLRPNMKFTLEPTFVRVGSLQNDGLRNAGAMANLDGDSFPELILGNFSGGVRYFKGEEYRFPNISIVENDLNLEMKMYPNPAKGFFTLEWSDVLDDELDLNVYNINGQLVISKEVANGEQISTDHLSTGLYVVQIVSQGKFAASEKLVIIND
jgi:hypothetical protein